MNQKDFNIIFTDLIRNPDSNKYIELLNQIKDGPILSASRAIEIYQEDYLARLTASLKNTYMAIYSIIGEVDFNSLANDYINIFPSQSSDLDDYGNQLSTFISTHQIKKDYNFLSELAHFEWSFRQIFHCEQILGLTSLDLTKILSGEEALVQLVSSAQLLSYNFDITFLYNLKENQTDDKVGTDLNINIQQFILMTKIDGLVKARVLSKNQWEIMIKLVAPCSLLDLFDNAPNLVTPEEIQSLFQFFGTDQILQKI